MIKTFRGLLADGGQNIIRLSTKKGKIGYKVIKFELFPNVPGENEYRSLVQIFKVVQTSVPDDAGTCDFSNNQLLAAGFLALGAALDESVSLMTIFDNDIVNQDIYITHTQQAGGEPINYYLELEVMNLSDNATVVSTLRSIRMNPQVGG